MALKELQEKFMHQIQEETQALETREAELKRKEEMLEEEKEKMTAYKNRKAAALDIVEINVGGEIMATKRSTLTLAKGSLLEAIFSGRWEESLDRDGSGRVFMDFSPDVFRILLSHLRVVRDAKPEQIVKLPEVPDDRRAEFKSMTQFLELEEFLFGKQLCEPEALKLQCAEGSFGSCVVCNDGVVSGGNSTHAAVIGKAPLLSADATIASWKVSVESLPGGGWMYAGIVGHSAPPNTSYAHATSFGWACTNQVYNAGVNLSPAGGWNGWQQGDVAIFQIDASAKILRTYVHRLATTFTLALPDISVVEKMRLHLNLHAPGTRLEISAASVEDLLVFCDSE